MTNCYLLLLLNFKSNKMYRKIKRAWSHNDINYMRGFKKSFPELKNISSEEMCDRFCELGLDYFTETQEPVKLWVRFTLLFALITLVLMFIGLPFYFFISGNWGYPLGDNNRILNWLRMLRLQ